MVDRRQAAVFVASPRSRRLLILGDVPTGGQRSLSIQNQCQRVQVTLMAAAFSALMS